MKLVGMISMSALALALGACGKPTPQNDGAPVSEATYNAIGMAPAVGISADQAFANAAAASDAFEIETSKLAAQHASSPNIKSFAGHMIAAHIDSTAKLKSAAAMASPSVSPVATLSAAQRDELAKLGALSGDAFDTAYASAQTSAHQVTLGQLKAYASSGNAPSLKAFAVELVPVVTAHLNAAKSLSK